jgi:hypothetical protein
MTFGMVFCFLNIHPFLTTSGAKANVAEEQSCSKTACQKPAPACGRQAPVPEKEDCGSEGCNPFLPCSIGYCCYLVENFIVYSGAPGITKEKPALFNDNRIVTKISECWHPPEMIS